MTWSRFIATGEGAIELRLEIEGVAYEFVTALSMEQSLSDGRERVAGLQRQGIVLGEEVDPATADLSPTSFEARVVDRQIDRAVTAAFSTLPLRRTWLTGDESTSNTTIDVLSTSAFPSSGQIHIGTETITYTGKTSTSFTGCTRGVWGTTAQAHFTQTGQRLGFSLVSDTPQSIEGRRAFLHGYGEGDDFQGDGTLIWRGVCVTSPKLVDGHTWTIAIDPITTLMKQELGGNVETPLRPRGYYYPAQRPFALTIEETDSGGGDRTGPDTRLITGFFETLQDLAEEVQSELADLLSDGGYDTGFVNVGATEDGLTYEYTVIEDAGGDARLLKVSLDFTAAFSNGLFRPQLTGPVSFESQNPTVFEGDTIFGAKSLGSVAGFWGTRQMFADARERGSRSYPTISSNGFSVEGATPLPSTRIYVEREDVDLTSVESVTIRWPNGDESQHRASGSNVTSLIDITIRLDEFDALGGARYWGYGQDSPLIFISRSLTSVNGEGDLSDVISYVAANSPDVANAGDLPFLTDADLDTSEWSNAVNTAATQPIQQSRVYAASKALQFDRFLTEECKLLGLFPRITADGKIGAAQLIRPIDGVAGATGIGSDDVVIRGGFPTFELNALGSLNTYELATGYVALEDDHKGPTYTARRGSSFAARKAPRVLTVEPISRAQEEVTVEQVVAIAQGVLGVFGEEYAIIDVSVPFTFFDTLLGDVLRLSFHALPNFSGDRGYNRAGLVIGRRWQLDDAYGSLRLLTTLTPAAGYTPSVQVTTPTTNVSGNQWTITVTPEVPGTTVSLMPSNKDIGDFFPVGTKVQVTQWDDSSPTIVPGTVDAVDVGSDLITVTFDSTWTPGANTWILGYDQDAGDVIDDQEVYAYVADTDGEIGHSGGNQGAKVLS